MRIRAYAADMNLAQRSLDLDNLGRVRQLLDLYGFRYGKRAHEAVRAVETANQAGYVHAVDCDLESFFDTVNHERLMNLLARRIADSRVLRLIKRYLRAGVVLPDGQSECI